MTADEIEVGQTYRVTAAGLKSRSGWLRRSLGDVFYIAHINGDKFVVNTVKPGWGSSVYRDEIHLFERVGFHPNWNRVLRNQITRRLLGLAESKRDAKALLAALPNKIQSYEDEIAQLTNELATLQKERKS